MLPHTRTSRRIHGKLRGLDIGGFGTFAIALHEKEDKIMCLKIRNGSTTPSVAEEDIVCYKVLKRRTDVDKNVRYFAPIMDYEFIVGHENRESTGWFVYSSDNMVYHGFHSFEYKSDAIKFISRLVNDNFDMEGNLVVCKCTIPKYTRYYSGGVLYSRSDLALPNGYCSECIRIDKIEVSEKEVLEFVKRT